MNLPKRQQDVISILEKEPSLSLRKIAHRLGVKSANSVVSIVNALEKKGALSKVGHNTHKEYLINKDYFSPPSLYYDSNFNLRTSPEFERMMTGTH